MLLMMAQWMLNHHGEAPSAEQVNEALGGTPAAGAGNRPNVVGTNGKNLPAPSAEIYDKAMGGGVGRFVENIPYSIENVLGGGMGSKRQNEANRERAIQKLKDRGYNDEHIADMESRWLSGHNVKGKAEAFTGTTKGISTVATPGVTAGAAVQPRQSMTPEERMKQQNRTMNLRMARNIVRGPAYQETARSNPEGYRQMVAADRLSDLAEDRKALAEQGVPTDKYQAIAYNAKLKGIDNSIAYYQKAMEESNKPIEPVTGKGGPQAIDQGIKNLQTAGVEKGLYAASTGGNTSAAILQTIGGQHRGMVPGILQEIQGRLQTEHGMTLDLAHPGRPATKWNQGAAQAAGVPGATGAQGGTAGAPGAAGPRPRGQIIAQPEDIAGMSEQDRKALQGVDLIGEQFGGEPSMTNVGGYRRDAQAARTAITGAGAGPEPQGQTSQRVQAPEDARIPQDVQAQTENPQEQQTLASSAIAQERPQIAPVQPAQAQSVRRPEKPIVVQAPNLPVQPAHYKDMDPTWFSKTWWGPDFGGADKEDRSNVGVPREEWANRYQRLKQEQLNAQQRQNAINPSAGQMGQVAPIVPTTPTVPMAPTTSAAPITSAPRTPTAPAVSVVSGSGSPSASETKASK
jgi:hypothetical protein